ncbi:MAG: GTP 3',8-cyclase MoaA [Thermodesulfovibrionales bacterium]
MKTVCDKYERTIDYMRISVTDRCNLRCIYCMPSDGVRHIEFKDILKYEEITRVVRIAAKLGVRKIRITGGEPLFRRDLHSLISSLNRIEGIEDVGITTNGILLKRYARQLAGSGLKRVNVSLDSLKQDRYREITRGGDIRDVFNGILEAKNEGFLPIKINMIPIRGINDDEIEDFAMLTKYAPYHVRFIEFMPLAPGKLWAENTYVPTDEIKRRVSSIAPLTPVRVRKSGPARYYRMEGAAGVIGFISPVTHHFCDSCNRLRLTSEGKLRPCLFNDTEVDLRSAIRYGADDDEIERLLRYAIDIKPKRHSISSETNFDHLESMSRIGG